MSADMPERPDAPDDLERAYAQAQALADDGRRPAAAVRANVLAAARAIAEEATAQQAATLPLTPVAPPVGAVGHGRPKAINLSSWRVRSGAALCAVLLVGLAGWRFDETRRMRAGEQVAMAELRMAAAPTAALPRDLPVPPLPGASYPEALPPVVEDRAELARAPVAKQAAREKDLIVAQLDRKADLNARTAANADAPTPARRMAPAAPLAPAAVPAEAAAAPVVVAGNASLGEGQPTQQDPTTVTVRAAPQVATEPAKLPSVVPRRVLVPSRPVPEVVATAAAPAPAAALAPPPRALDKATAGNTTMAAADPERQRVDVTGERPGLSSATAADAARKVTASSVGSLVSASARVVPTPLHAAADRGDVETLRKLLDSPTTPVDAPDATGRTALLHAVLAQQVGAVRLLLAAGADPAHADRAGLTPRAAAQAGASAEIGVLLAAPR